MKMCRINNAGPSHVQDQQCRHQCLQVPPLDRQFAPSPAPAPPMCRINNAGTNAYKYRPLTDSTDEDLQEIVTTNVLGIMLCCREVRGREYQALNFRAMQWPIFPPT